MREMKDSNQEWLGLIPADWEQSTISSLYAFRNEKVSDKDYPPLSVTMRGVVPQLETAAKTDAHDDRKLVKKGDFAINSRSDRRGSCGISDYDGSVSLINTVLTPREEMNPHYYNWLFHTVQFADEFYRWGHGIVDDLWTTRWQEMKNIVVTVPSLEQQEIIAQALDNAVSKVDALIANQEAQIEKLKQYKLSLITEVVTRGLDPDAPMKDSGFEWIGIIPTHWTIARKLSFQVKEDISYGIVKLFEPDDINGVKVIRCSDVLEGTIDPQNIRTVTKRVSDEYSRTILKGGEVLVNVRGSLGGCAVVPPEMAGYNIAREVAKITLKNALINRFVMYYMLSNAFVDYRTRYLSGSVYIGLNIELLSVCPIPMPSIFEQKQICGFLDEKCQSIDNLITLKYQKINKLNEYRKSLIYEYVTGKKLTR